MSYRDSFLSYHSISWIAELIYTISRHLHLLVTKCGRPRGAIIAQKGFNMGDTAIFSKLNELEC